jgi:hypothetical protein
VLAPLPDRVLRLTTTLGLSLFLLGCTTGQSVDTTARDASIYHAVITDLRDRSGQTLDAGDGEVPVVFIETLGSEAIALETQVEVIAKLAETYEIRFIDDLDEAVEIDVDGRPVRLNSLLIGLGPVQADKEAEVRGEVYLRADEIRAYRYSLVSLSDGGWTMAGPPEEAEPEGFHPNP